MESGLLFMVLNTIIVKYPVHFWPFLKAPAEKNRGDILKSVLKVD